MQCPRMHGSMEPVLLNAEFSEPQQAHLCSECHGVWMRANECQAVLGVDTGELIVRSNVAPVRLACPHCQTICRHASILPTDFEPIPLHVCPRCLSAFFDANGFSLTLFQQIKQERAVSCVLDQSPLDHLDVPCCDCGAEVANLDELHNVGIGYCCARCRLNPPILSEGKIQNVQLVTFHGMEIKIDHWLSTTRSRIAVTPVDPCLLNVCLSSLSPLQRVLRFGHRTLRLGGNLRRHLDATEGCDLCTPWHLFLVQRGVSQCLEDLVSLGEIVMTFKPHSIVFEMTAKRLGTDVRQKFETTIRRLLIAYERFTKLLHQYEIPDLDE